MNFVATKRAVANRGVPPDSFLSALVLWGRTAPAEIFAQNDNSEDIYSLIAPVLGNDTKPRWNGLPHRRAAMLEVMRAHAGLESSWNWKEGVDVTNQHSLHNLTGEEAGIFQVSYDSLWLAHDGSLHACLLAHGVAIDPANFIGAMKQNHDLAMEYYARLVRISIAWAGPLKRREIIPWLSKNAVAEFQTLPTTA